MTSAVREADHLQDGLTARRALASKRVAARLDDFQSKLTAVTGSVPSEHPSNSWWLPPRSLASLRALASRLGDLQDAVDGADAAPTPDARAGLALVEPGVEAGLAAWKRLQEGPLADLEKVLEHAGMPPL